LLNDPSEDISDSPNKSKPRPQPDATAHQAHHQKVGQLLLKQGEEKQVAQKTAHVANQTAQVAKQILKANLKPAQPRKARDPREPFQELRA
jgi:hypothetical protein